MSTTPSEVLAEAKRLMGQEVELTLRGRLQQGALGSDRVILAGGSFVLSLNPGETPRECLVGIKPAPLQIVPGELYDIPGYGLCRAGTGGRAYVLEGPARGKDIPAQAMFGIKRVKVVPE